MAVSSPHKRGKILIGGAGGALLRDAHGNDET
jgi:hypothetical protein